jgi:glutamate formiminotransferase
MSARPRLLECVPNVSEGRDTAAIARMAGALGASRGVRLVNVHADPDHHRAVLSFLGDPAAVETAALALAEAVFAAVDMRGHRGMHPRIGALDVLPFVPLGGTTMAEAVAVAHRVGRALAARHEVPVYFYAHAALVPGRRRLPDARRGGYEALPARLDTEDGRPDAGPARFDPARGAVLVGARDLLVAYNVWLDGEDVAAARAIAAGVRESSGGLPALQALGLALPSRRLTQVSMNLLDHRRTPIPAAFDAVVAEARRHGVRVRCAELVGVAPRAAFAGRAPETVGLLRFDESLYLDAYLDAPRPEP